VSAPIRVGICSWADPALIESRAFYPKKSMSAEARLRFYAGVFDVVEVNASYYAIPDVLTVRRWAERTPAGFVFHVKAWSLMTGHHPRPQSLAAHVQRLLSPCARRTPRGEIEAGEFPPEAVDEAFRLFRAALAPLAEAGKLGYILFQLAPWVRYDTARLDYLASLPSRLPGWTLAVEFRHRSWLPDHAHEALGALRAARLANVVVDGPVSAGSIPRVAEVTAPTAVFRLHGRNAEGWARQLRGEEPAVREKYDYLYTDAELRELLPEVEEAAAETSRVYVSFNNNNRDYPVRNALMMKALLGEPVARRDSLPGDLFA
jgi:uncharacterized protein YecE (DUF72 family)